MLLSPKGAFGADGAKSLAKKPLLRFPLVFELPWAEIVEEEPEEEPGGAPGGGAYCGALTSPFFMSPLKSEGGSEEGALVPQML